MKEKNVHGAHVAIQTCLKGEIGSICSLRNKQYFLTLILTLRWDRALLRIIDAHNSLRII